MKAKARIQNIDLYKEYKFSLSICKSDIFTYLLLYSQCDWRVKFIQSRTKDW